jgi:hypothetical protein
MDIARLQACVQRRGRTRKGEATVWIETRAGLGRPKPAILASARKSCTRFDVSYFRLMLLTTRLYMGTNDTPKLDDFKWDDEDVVIQQVDAVAVYRNPHGDLVIRQRDTTSHDDSVVVVPLERAKALRAAIKREMKAAKVKEAQGPEKASALST